MYEIQRRLYVDIVVIIADNILWVSESRSGISIVPSKIAQSFFTLDYRRTILQIAS